MRIAVFGDIHGNLSALNAVLADIDSQGQFDSLVCVGDLCLYGPHPRECLQLIRSRDEEISCLYGETDQWVDGPPLLSADIEKEENERRRHIRNVVDWTREQLPERDRAWLRALPFQRRISPTVNPWDDLLIVHANPRDAHQFILPPERQQRTAFGRVCQSDENLGSLLAGLVGKVLVFGHLHHPFVRKWGPFRLVNAGGLSMPADRNPRARYATFTWIRDAEDWRVRHHVVQYDLVPEIEAFQRARPPGWQKAVQSLKARGMIPQQLMYPILGEMSRSDE